MLVNTKHSGMATFGSPYLIDEIGIPRYWAAVWASFLPASHAPATVGKKLSQLDRFYRHAESLLGTGGLDNALSNFDVEAICSSLEGYFLSIKNSSKITKESEDRWQLAIQFVNEITQRICRNHGGQKHLAEFQAGLRELDLAHSTLHIGRRRHPERIRSLPSEVVEYLYQLLDPESSINPFQNRASRWRVYVSFIVMLHQGLRRSELLVLPVDVIKKSFDRSLNKDRFWINVKYNEYEDDPRYSKPGIKNPSSIRQLPISSVIALIVQEYTSNYRGRVRHSFLINSQKHHPLSPEGVTYIFKKITDSLPQSLRKSLRDHTGADSISAHDLRHTSAVVRLNQLLSEGVEMDDAMQRMRAFFGWSRESDMPLRYARAVFEDRLASIWKAEFDDRVSILRSLSTRSK